MRACQNQRPRRRVQPPQDAGPADRSFESPPAVVGPVYVGVLLGVECSHEQNHTTHGRGTATEPLGRQWLLAWYVRTAERASPRWEALGVCLLLCLRLIPRRGTLFSWLEDFARSKVLGSGRGTKRVRAPVLISSLPTLNRDNRTYYMVCKTLFRTDFQMDGVAVGKKKVAISGKR